MRSRLGCPVRRIRRTTWASGRPRSWFKAQTPRPIRPRPREIACVVQGPWSPPGVQLAEWIRLGLLSKTAPAGTCSSPWAQPGRNPNVARAGWHQATGLNDAALLRATALRDALDPGTPAAPWEPEKRAGPSLPPPSAGASRTARADHDHHNRILHGLRGTPVLRSAQPGFYFLVSSTVKSRWRSLRVPGVWRRSGWRVPRPPRCGRSPG
jgi:hypothetical protein